METDPGLDVLGAAPDAELGAPGLGSSTAPASGGAVSDEDLALVLDVPVELTVGMGRATMTIREALSIAIGSIITLDKVVGEPVDLFANGRLIARGEVIAIDEEYGFRVTEVVAQPSLGQAA